MSDLLSKPAARALLTAVLLWASHFPLNFAPLAWVALVPLLTLVPSAARPRTLYLSAWLGGLAFFLAALQWVRVAHPMMYFAWIFLALYCSAYFPLALWLLRRLRLPLVLGVPLVWLPLDWFRAWFGGGFAWYYLGHTQHAMPLVLQVADLGGAYAVTLLVAVVNGAVADWLVGGWSRRTRIVASIAVVALVIAALGYGMARHELPTRPGPRVALVQGNVPQLVKNEGGAALQEHFAELADEAARSNPPPDLVVWPETSYPHSWVDLGPGARREYLTDEGRQVIATREAKLRADLARWGRPHLLGLSTFLLQTHGREDRRNSALLVAPPMRVLGRYDKIHCVPFGEYVPFKQHLPWLQMFTPYDEGYDLTPGTELTRFELPTPAGPVRFGCLICYEDSDPTLARQYAANDRVDFLVNQSNDGWFNGSSEHEEHLAVCRFRAVECRLPVVRAVNMGISAVIAPNGDVTALPGPTWATSKKVAGIVSAVVPLSDTGPTLYARWGDWLPALATVGLLAGLIAVFARK